jgi:hypothetical protein
MFMLHVSAACGHLQATHFLWSLLHCALGQIELLRHIVAIINFDVTCYLKRYLSENNYTKTSTRNTKQH